MSQKETTKSKSKLPPLYFDEEIERFEAKSESKEVKFGRCTHKDSHMEGNYLVCPCGSMWSGPRIHELLEFFRKRK